MAWAGIFRWWNSKSLFEEVILNHECLENPRDGGAWWAAVDGVAQSDMTKAT